MKVCWVKEIKEGTPVFGRSQQRNECYLGINEGGAFAKKGYSQGAHHWDLKVIGITQPSGSPKYPYRNGIGIVC